MRTSYPSALKTVAAVLALLISPALALAQGQTYDNCDAWTADLCGTVIGDDFESVVDENGNRPTAFFGGGVPAPQNLAFGQLSQQGNVPPSISFFVTENPDGSPLEMVAFGEFVPIVFTLDPTLGPLEGVCFSYGAQNGGPGIVLSAYDGDALVASIPLPQSPDPLDPDALQTFGWRNTDGLNITRLEFTTTDDNVGFVGNGQLSFGVCEEPAETCFDQLEVVRANLDAYVSTLDGNQLCIGENALDCVSWMQGDVFWEQPSGDRLSRYGGSMFIGAAYAICYLEWLDNPEADALIDELIVVLECIVDKEIAYAIENGGNQCYIERAEDFAELGEIIDDDFDNEVVASLAYRLAWLHAYYATY